MQANQKLQQQIQLLHQDVGDKATSFSNQAQAWETEKAALQQDLAGLAQQVKAAEFGKSELQERLEMWKSKCSKYQQVRLFLMQQPMHIHLTMHRLAELS